MVAVLRAARALPSLELDARHLGSQAEVEQRILSGVGIPTQALAVHGLRGSNPVSMAFNAARLGAAVGPALKAIRQFNPQVVLASGGYASAPVVIAARLRRVPVVLFSADVSAGLAIRLEARLAQRIFVPLPEAAAGLPPDRTRVSGYPVRPDMEQLPPRPEAKVALGFDPNQPLLLCFGGSQGARTLNDAIASGLDELLPVAQVLHLAGAADAPALMARRTARYRVEAFLEDMPKALAAADVCVCRAGASTLGELPAAGVPAVLVPYPYAGGHQRHNAAVLVRGGGAVALTNDEVRGGALMPVVLSLLADGSRLESMATAMRSMSRPAAAAIIAESLLELAA